MGFDTPHSLALVCENPIDRDAVAGALTDIPVTHVPADTAQAPETGDRVIWIIACHSAEQQGRWVAWIDQAQADLLVCEPLPEATAGDKRDHWLQELKDKLATLLYRSQARISTVLLAASLGGPEAVASFFARLAGTALPLAFVYAQHNSEGGAALLRRVLENSLPYPLYHARAGETLHPGALLLVPVDRVLTLGAGARICLGRSHWPGPYQPSVDTLLKSFSEALGEQLLTIVFSGLCDDGARQCLQSRRRGSRIWCQDSTSCAASAMPDAVAETLLKAGEPVVRADPTALAQRLLDLYRNQP